MGHQSGAATGCCTEVGTTAGIRSQRGLAATTTQALSSAVPCLVSYALEASNCLKPLYSILPEICSRLMLSAHLLRCCRLLYKNDGNAVGRTCWLHIRGLQTDGLHFKGAEKLLIRNDLPWEGAVIEVRHQPQLCCSKVVKAALVVATVIEARHQSQLCCSEVVEAALGVGAVIEVRHQCWSEVVKAALVVGEVIEVRHQPQLCCSKVVKVALVVGTVHSIAPMSSMMQCCWRSTGFCRSLRRRHQYSPAGLLVLHQCLHISVMGQVVQGHL